MTSARPTTSGLRSTTARGPWRSSCRRFPRFSRRDSRRSVDALAPVDIERDHGLSIRAPQVGPGGEQGWPTRLARRSPARAIRSSSCWPPSASRSRRGGWRRRKPPGRCARSPRGPRLRGLSDETEGRPGRAPEAHQPPRRPDLLRRSTRARTSRRSASSRGRRRASSSPSSSTGRASALPMACSASRT